MWWKTAKVGDKIVCIDDGSDDNPHGLPTPERGRIYEIENIVPDDLCGRPECKVYLWVIGVNSECWAAMFKPVDPASKKADRVLASLKPSLLNPIPIRKHETVGGE